MRIEAEEIVNAPASEAWLVLGEQFGEVAEWASDLEESFLDGELAVGATRTATFGRRGRVTERLTEFDPSAMAFTYVSTSGTPPGLVRGANRWTVEPEGRGRCRVTTRAVLDLSWWLRPFGFVLRFVMRPRLDRMGEELRYRIEEGRPHPRKGENK